jgi:hypothetical protein
MKKLIFVVLTVLIVACSSEDSSDDDNSCDFTDVSFFEGNWSFNEDFNNEIGWNIPLTFNNEGVSINDASLITDFTDDLYTLELRYSIEQAFLLVTLEFINCNQVRAMLWCCPESGPYYLNRE